MVLGGLNWLKIWLKGMFCEDDN